MTELEKAEIVTKSICRQAQTRAIIHAVCEFVKVAHHLPKEKREEIKLKYKKMINEVYAYD